VHGYPHRVPDLIELTDDLGAELNTLECADPITNPFTVDNE
jgi:hypothetical protein